MSKRNNPTSTDAVKPVGQETQIISSAAPQDLWGNLIFFVIVTTAIVFVLINNPASALLSTTGIIVLAVLFLLDLLSIVPLTRILLAYLILRPKNKK